MGGGVREVWGWTENKGARRQGDVTEEDDGGRRLERGVLGFDTKAGPKTVWCFHAGSLCPSPNKQARWEIDPLSRSTCVDT